MKKIGVNTRLLLSGKLEGIGKFTDEVLQRIVKANPQIEFHFFFDRKFSEEFVYAKNVTPHVLFPQARHPILWKWFFDYSIPKKLKQLNCEAFISTDGYNSLNTNLPSYCVIHDLAFEHFPNANNKWQTNFMQKNTPLYAQKANQIGTVSQFSKNDISKQYNIPLAKIDVLYNGCNSSCKPLSIDAQKKVRTKYTDGADYFLFVSAIHPRKNLERLLKAFDAFKNSSENKMKLLVVGRMAWKTGSVAQTMEKLKHKEDVICVGHLLHSELEKVYASAFALCYTSLFEGFGIPILEAMFAECAVITSNTSSMPEVAGNATLLVNPESVDSIKDAMLKLFNDRNLRNELIEKGRTQKTKFNWEKTADLFWDSFSKILT